ncbi:glycosyltransferase family 2 protein [Flavobacterium sp.]|uniref:glycosyltransferase family 2 protein n=1 Tax=Flavobacterium sp. TaxID=239 RepID=UPI003752B518
MKPYFSVIIPLYNKENFITNTLKSVLNQTFTDYEIIIIDDCSIDDSLKLVSNIVNEKINIIKHEVNKGLSASRNTGIRNSNANYVAFLDADDLWKETFLEEVSLLINQFAEAKLFGTNYEEIYSEKTVLKPNNYGAKIIKNTLIPDYFEISLSQPLYCPSSFCVEKTVFENIGFYNEKITFGEDVDFNIRANSNYKLAYSNKILVSYLCFSENQITQSNLSNKIITDFDFYENKYSSKSLKKFLDFNRYIMAKHYKVEGDFKRFSEMKKGIITSNLNLKQLLLLNSPRLFLKIIIKIKMFFINKKIRLTTYG